MFETVYKLTQIEKSVAEFTSKKRASIENHDTLLNINNL